RPYRTGRVIPLAYVQAWRTRAPWVQTDQVEQDLVLSRAIIDIYSEPALAAGLAFRGGTILHKVVLQPTARYSEDVDLVQVVPGDIGPIIDAIRRRLDPWLGVPRRDVEDRATTLAYRFAGEEPPHSTL